MKRLTIILAHQNFEKSIANKAIIEALMEQFPEAHLRSIYTLYPDFKIDTEREQEIMLHSDIVLFQFPLLWYNMPAILKQWFDAVFTHNFAYGSKGDKMKNKIFLASITVGGPYESYSPLGYNHFRVEDFFKNIEQTAYLAQMKYIPPVFGYGNTYIAGVYNTPELVKQRAIEQSKRLIDVIKNLTKDETEDNLRLFVAKWFAHFDIFTDPEFFLQYLDLDVELNFPDGVFKGHEGFLEWYAPIRLTMEPISSHTIESIVIEGIAPIFTVKIDLTYQGKTKQGELINQPIEEEWTVEADSDKTFKILTYESRKRKTLDK